MAHWLVVCQGVGSFDCGMADPNARLVKFPWVWDDGEADNGQKTQGYLSMSLGTYRYLFPSGILPVGDKGLYSSKEQTEKTYTRHLYPGGPVVTCTRKRKMVNRTRSMTAMTASSERKFILHAHSILGESQDTIHYTGPTWACVAFLKKNVAGIENGSIAIQGPHGQTYTSIDPLKPVGVPAHV